MYSYIHGKLLVSPDEKIEDGTSHAYYVKNIYIYLNYHFVKKKKREIAIEIRSNHRDVLHALYILYIRYDPI